MMKRQGRFLHGWLLPATAVVAVVAGVFFSPAIRDAKACWNIVVIECFDQNPRITWPFASPVGSQFYWRRNPQPPYVTWGFQNNVYSTAICPTSTQALWCIGYPPSNDPEYDFYPRNYDAYITYGPINLSTAVAAFLDFYLLDRTQPQRDSVYWGAATTYILNSLSVMNIGGSHSGEEMSDFELRRADLSNLRNAESGDSVSMLGEPVVYVFWRFRSDPDAVTKLGAFVDNVDVAWDDGGMDLICGGLTVMNPDCTLAQEPVVGDSLWAQFVWRSCPGGIPSYPDFHLTATLDGELFFDSLMQDVQAGTVVNFYTPFWRAAWYGTHVLRVVVDSLNEVTETLENNNVCQVSFIVLPRNPPPTFIWITPGTDTLWADAEAILRWEAYDEDEEGVLEFFTDSDPNGCRGLPLPNGERLEHDGRDSLVWDTRSLSEGRRYFPFVRVTDEDNDTCIYAPFPVIIRHSSDVVDRDGEVPRAFYLEQNYPNPFNPTTEFRFGIARGGHVSLRVFDLLGRDVATLMDEHLASGSYTAVFDGRSHPTGIYLGVLTAPEGMQTRKMMLLK